MLVIAELSQNEPIAMSYEMLGLARRLVDTLPGKVSIALLGHHVEQLGQPFIARGADDVYIGDRASSSEYQAEAWMPYVLDVVRQASPTAIFLPHTTMGADLAPRLAFRLKTGVAMGCLAVA